MLGNMGNLQILDDFLFPFFHEQSWELLFPRGQRKICLRLVLFLLSAIGKITESNKSCPPAHQALLPSSPCPAWPSSTVVAMCMLTVSSVMDLLVWVLVLVLLSGLGEQGPVGLGCCWRRWAPVPAPAQATYPPWPCLVCTWLSSACCLPSFELLLFFINSHQIFIFHLKHLWTKITFIKTHS